MAFAAYQGILLLFRTIISVVGTSRPLLQATWHITYSNKSSLTKLYPPIVPKYENKTSKYEILIHKHNISITGIELISNLELKSISLSIIRTITRRYTWQEQ